MDNITLHIKLEPLPLDQFQAQLVALIDSCGYKGAHECPIIRGIDMALPLTDAAKRALKPYPELEFQIKELSSHMGALACKSYVEFLDALRIRQSRIFSQAISVISPSFSKPVDWAFRRLVEQGAIGPLEILPSVQNYIHTFGRTNNDLKILEILQSTLAYHIKIRGDRTYPIHLEFIDNDRAVFNGNGARLIHAVPIPPGTTYIPGSERFEVSIGPMGTLVPTGTQELIGPTGISGTPGLIGTQKLIGPRGISGTQESIELDPFYIQGPMSSPGLNPGSFYIPNPLMRLEPFDILVPSMSTPPSVMPAPSPAPSIAVPPVEPPALPINFPEETSAPQDPVDLSCTVCLDRHRNCLILPCNHLCCCHSCGLTLKQCPICRGTIGSLHPVFIV